MTTTAPEELPNGPALLPLAILALVNALIIAGLVYDFIHRLIT